LRGIVEHQPGWLAFAVVQAQVVAVDVEMKQIIGTQDLDAHHHCFLAPCSWDPCGDDSRPHSDRAP